MKDKIIETAGKTWRCLAEKGEVSVNDVSKLINERAEITFQALGWLAREDKISYTNKNKKDFVSLVESELNQYKKVLQNTQPKANQRNIR